MTHFVMHSFYINERLNLKDEEDPNNKCISNSKNKQNVMCINTER